MAAWEQAIHPSSSAPATSAPSLVGLRRLRTCRWFGATPGLTRHCYSPVLSTAAVGQLGRIPADAAPFAENDALRKFTAPLIGQAERVPNRRCPALKKIFAIGVGRNVSSIVRSSRICRATTATTSVTSRRATLAINANDEPSRFAGFGLPIIADRIEGHAGPLAGLHAALVWARESGANIRHVVTVACDTPFLPDDLVERFLAALEETGRECCVARSGKACIR